VLVKKDKEKFQKCKDKNISLHVIDISPMNIFKEKEADIYFEKIKKPISEKLL